MGKRKIGQKVIIEAIKKADGILVTAAESLGCSRRTIYNYIEKYPKVAEAYDEANETNIDKVESKLMTLIKEKNVPSTIFFLKTKGRSRGYAEHIQVAPVDPTGTKEYGADIRNIVFSKLLPDLAVGGKDGNTGKPDG